MSNFLTKTMTMLTKRLSRQIRVREYRGGRITFDPSSPSLFLRELRDKTHAKYRVPMVQVFERVKSYSTSFNTILKRPRDSYVEDFIRFKSEPRVREDYINNDGRIRIGKLLEDLDALAACCGYLHVGNASGKLPTMVTASMDRLDLLQDIPDDVDIMVSGHVTYVGTSSCEISVQMETCSGVVPPEGDEKFGFDASYLRPTGKPILTARFVMVALDPSTGKPTPIPQLQLDTEEDRRHYKIGAENKLRKSLANQVSLTKKPPTIEEMYLVHELYKKNMAVQKHVVEKDYVGMKDTLLHSINICMPQDRNIHNKIFGGFLMRLAFELAYANALIFCKSKVHFVAMDDIHFAEPVNIGSLLSLTSQVVYSNGDPSKSMQISVQADVMDPKTESKRTTNTFHFTFVAVEEVMVPSIMPQSYQESMLYLDGRRRSGHVLP